LIKPGVVVTYVSNLTSVCNVESTGAVDLYQTEVILSWDYGTCTLFKQTLTVL